MAHCILEHSKHLITCKRLVHRTLEYTTCITLQQLLHGL